MLYKLYEWLKSLVHFAPRNTHRATDSSVVAPSKALRLAVIARERINLKLRLEDAKRQKKARRHIYAALEALRTEELRIEAGQ